MGARQRPRMVHEGVGVVDPNNDLLGFIAGGITKATGFPGAPDAEVVGLSDSGGTSCGLPYFPVDAKYKGGTLRHV